MPGSIVDLQTVFQNTAQGINALQQAYLDINGSDNACDISTATQVLLGRGRIARLSVTVAGSADGMIYDSNNVGAPTNSLCVIPQELGIHLINLPVNFGAVVSPGTGQTVTISYSKYTPT